MKYIKREINYTFSVNIFAEYLNMENSVHKHFEEILTPHT